MIEFFKKNYPIIILAAVFAFVIIFSLVNLTLRPSLWLDEALNIEIAHNFLLFKKLNILVAPGVFAEYPYMVSSTGYPVTVPLAGFFSVFGFGLAQARIYMLFWVLAALAAIFLIVRLIFGNLPAISAVLLTATLAPFYNNALTTMGDAPGFVFLLLGFYFLAKKEKYFLTGLFFGLAIASKPSLYLTLLLALFVYILLLRKNIFFSLVKFAFGSVLPVLLHAFFVIPRAFFSITEWAKALKYYQNPFIGSPSLTENIFNNLSQIPFNSTLAYFAFLIFIIVFALSRDKDLSGAQRKMVLLFMVYGSFVFMYFLRSPGWLRYLFPLQILTFIFLFPSFSAIFKKLRQRFTRFLFIPADSLALVLCILFALVQMFQLLFISNLAYSRHSATIRYQETAFFINNHYPDASVGLIDLPEVAAFITSDKKYHMIEDVGFIGENPLFLSTELLPTLIVFRTNDGEALISSRWDVLEKNYFLVTMIADNYAIFHRL